MDYWRAILLGAVQGVTEILPISSDGHLSVLMRLLGYQGASELDLTAVLHLGTGLALVVFFLPRIGSTLRSLFSGNGQLASNSRLLVGRIVLAAAPVSVAGLLAGSFLERLDNSMPLVAVCFTGNGLLLLASRLGRDRKRRIDWLVALLVGLSQVFALLPGISRSGTTIATALFLGVSGAEAFDFSFLLAVPITLGAGVVTLLRDSSCLPGLAITSIGVGSAFVFGLMGLFLLRQLVKLGRLFWFGVYCLALAVLLMLCQFSR